jgi:solute carrier family 26 (sodium-independent sulfate anion transporter), member 11
LQSAQGVEHAVARVDRALAFPSAAFVRRALSKAAGHLPLVLDATHVQAADFTAAEVPLIYVPHPQTGLPVLFLSYFPSAFQ